MTTSADPLPDQLKAAIETLRFERHELAAVIADPNSYGVMTMRLRTGRLICALAHVEEIRALLLLRDMPAKGRG